jgi:hypothetical protein
MKQTAIVVVTLVLLAAAAWFAWRAQPAGDVLPAAPGTDAERGEAAALGAPSASDPPASSAEIAREAVRAPALAEAARVNESESARARLRGRCVDEATGAPLAACRVSLFGVRQAATHGYEGAHGPIRWEDPRPQTTAEDGLFSFTFTPPPPYAFELRVEHTEHLGGHVYWEHIDPGVLDVGDLRIPAGCRVRGVVKDTRDAVQAGVLVNLDDLRGWVSGPGWTPLRPNGARTSADGGFALRVSAGRWTVRSDREIVAPESVEIAPGQSELAVDVTVRALDDIESIRGVVVDDAGEAVRSGSVRGGWSSARIERDGSFFLARKGTPEEEVHLTVETTEGEHEKLVTPEAHRWGAKDVRLVLLRRLAGEIVVVERATGAPIEDYAVRCFPAPRDPNAPVQGSDAWARAAGHHPEGRVRLERIARGGNVLIVEPAGDYDRTRVVAFDSAQLAAGPLRVELSRTVASTVRVRRRGGAPVAGAEVELMRPAQCVPSDLVPRSLLGVDQDPADPGLKILVAAGKTDASGTCVLRAPPDVEVRLRVRGPGHPPWIAEGIALADGKEIEITVDDGATLAGTIAPLHVLDELRRWATDVIRPLGVVLSRDEGTPRRFPLDYRETIPIDADGAFSCAAVPSGTWRASLDFYRDFGNGARAASVPLRTVVLREGETTELHADVAAHCPGRVHGRVLLDGAEASEGAIALMAAQPDGRGGHAWTSVQGGPLDGAGTFAARVPAGTYGLVLWLTRDRGMLGLPARERVTVSADSTVEQLFTVESAVLRLRALGSDGRPCAGVIFVATSDDGAWTATARPTGADGWTALDPVPAGRLAIAARPRSLSDPRAWQALTSAKGGDAAALARVHVSVASVDARAGVTTEAEVSLPESAGY